jgi:hypothetical protein
MAAAARFEGTAVTPIDNVTVLRAPSPNPAVSGGDIRFSLRNPGTVELDVFTVNGQHVKQLAGGWYGAGDHSVAWQRAGKTGEPLANGIYVVRFRGDGVTRSQKLVILP